MVARGARGLQGARGSSAALQEGRKSGGPETRWPGRARVGAAGWKAGGPETRASISALGKATVHVQHAMTLPTEVDSSRVLVLQVA